MNESTASTPNQVDPKLVDKAMDAIDKLQEKHGQKAFVSREEQRAYVEEHLRTAFTYEASSANAYIAWVMLGKAKTTREDSRDQISG